MAGLCLQFFKKIWGIVWAGAAVCAEQAGVSSAFRKQSQGPVGGSEPQTFRFFAIQMWTHGKM